MMTISNHGGGWHGESSAGVARRDVKYQLSTTFDDVASRLIYLS